MPLSRACFLSIALLLFGACSSPSPAGRAGAGSSGGPSETTPPSSEATKSQPASSPKRITLGLPKLSGISGATFDGQKLWLVTERKKALIEFATDTLATRTFSIVGLDDNVDLESITRLPNGRFMIGSEINEFEGTPGEGKYVEIYSASLQGSELKIGDKKLIPLSKWAMTGTENQGIEGLCHAGATLVAGVEATMTKNGKRVAPLIAMKDGRPLVPFWLELTSETGKLSALDCKSTKNGIELSIVERHFGITRILRAVVPDTPNTVVRPSIIRNLDAFAKSSKLNMEGIARIGDEYYLAVDNEWKTITGENELVKVAP